MGNIVIYCLPIQFFPGRLDLMQLSVKFQLPKCSVLGARPRSLFNRSAHSARPGSGAREVSNRQSAKGNEQEAITALTKTGICDYFGETLVSH